MAKPKKKTTAATSPRTKRRAAAAKGLNAKIPDGFTAGEKVALFAFRVVQITHGDNYLFGLGNDNKVYLWDAFTGTWKPNTMSEDAKAHALKKAAAERQYNNGTAVGEPATLTPTPAADGQNPLS